MSFLPTKIYLLFISLVSASAASAQTLGGGESPDVSIWRVLLALLLCIFIAVLVIWFFHTRNMSNPGGAKLPEWLSRFSFLSETTQEREIEILEMRKLNPQNDVCLMRCRDHEYLLLLTGSKTKILQKTPLSDQDGLSDDG